MRWYKKLLAGAVGLGACGAASGVGLWYAVGGFDTSRRRLPVEHWCRSPTRSRPNSNRQLAGCQRLTLFQYQTCPFCCKVRAYLDYRGLSYDIVEVNSITREQIAWCHGYGKVPILRCQMATEAKAAEKEGENAEREVVLKDSSVIVSALESHLRDPKLSLAQLRQCYPGIVGQQGGRLTFANRHFVMQPHAKQLDSELARDEAKWREWVDTVFVHSISPNIYRSLPESVRTFRWFADEGEWSSAFSPLQRVVIVYAGAVAMRLVGERLRRKYSLHPDVRQSLYAHVDDFLRAVGKRQFRGGDSPDLSDLAMYGALSAMRGTEAFADATANCSGLANWYDRMHRCVAGCQGDGG